MSDAEKAEYRFWFGRWIETHAIHADHDGPVSIVLPTQEECFTAGYAAAAADTARLVRAAVEETIYAAATRQWGDAIDVDAIIARVMQSK